MTTRVRFCIFSALLLLAGCIAAPTATPLPPTETIEATFTMSLYSETPLEATKTTQFATLSPTPTSTSTPTPPIANSPTPDANSTPTQEFFDLQECVTVAGATCRINGRIELTSQLTISASGVTLIGGEITNAPEYPNRLVAVIRTSDVRFEGVSIYGTIANEKSAIKDCLLILDSTRIVLDHVTLKWCEDENGDIQNSIAVEIYNSVFIQPLRNAMHVKGAHPYNMLITNSEVLIKDSVFSSAQARNPQAQNSRLTMENVLLDNIDGSGIQTACGAVLDTSGLMIRGGGDTDELSYGIVAVNQDECIDTPFALITEKCSFVSNWHVAGNGNKYPRVRRYGGDRLRYANPLTNTEFLSDTTECEMPTERTILEVIENAGVDAPACLLAANCRILDSPS